MRNLIYIAVVIASIVLVCLYLLRIHTVPAQVKDALQTEQGAPVDRMTQIPARVKQKMEAANRTADSTMGDAMKSVDKESK